MYLDVSLESVIEIGLHHHRSLLQKFTIVIAFVNCTNEISMWSLLSHFSHVTRLTG